MANETERDYSNPESDISVDDNDSDSDYVYCSESSSGEKTKVTKSARKLNSDEEISSVLPTKRVRL